MHNVTGQLIINSTLYCVLILATVHYYTNTHNCLLHVLVISSLLLIRENNDIVGGKHAQGLESAIKMCCYQ